MLHGDLDQEKVVAREGGSGDVQAAGGGVLRRRRRRRGFEFDQL
jgi:hypothetical protein